MSKLNHRSFVECARFWKQSDGQVALIFALSIIPIVSAVGAAVDYSSGNRMKAGLQAALDSAVLAAAIDDSINWQTVASGNFKGNSNIKGLDTSGVTPTFTKDGSVYHGQVSASAPTAFVKIFGVSSLRIGAKAAATTAYVQLCVLGLNAFDKGAFDMNGNSVFNAPGCGVQANTTASSGMTQEGKPTATAAVFNVSGGHTGTGYSSAPHDSATAVADPYSSVPFPDYDTCDKNAKGMVINGGSQTLPPGTYCGGLTIKGQASVTLQPGIYVMVNGSLLLDGGSSVSGTNLMVAFTGSDATLRVWGNSTLNLTSPTSGTYASFQFFQDVNDANGRGAWASIGGNGNNSDDTSKATWDGIAYFPTQNFWVYGNAVVNANSPSTAIVAGQIWDQGNATINITNQNTRGLNVTPAQVAGGARLLQ